jgi:hypothetical protein
MSFAAVTKTRRLGLEGSAYAMADAVTALDVPGPDLAAGEIQDRLKPFFAANPAASLGEGQGEAGRTVAIRNPWGDSSVMILVPDDLASLADALNFVYLPERLTALYHMDTHELEIIYTAFALNEQAGVKGRSFKFHHEGKEWACEYARSSERLLSISATARLVGDSLTNHRNLQPFITYSNLKRMLAEGRKFLPKFVDEPISFWIRGIEWNEDAIIAGATHLNFYMSYYDNRSPLIVMHPPKIELGPWPPNRQYRAGSFPKQIVAKKIDDNLLHFWSAAHGGEQAQRFLYYYRVIEYLIVHLTHSQLPPP